MKTIRDCFWLWGQTEGTHHATGNKFCLPGKNRMTPIEGCEYYDIPNICRVVSTGLPVPPFDQEAPKLDGLDQVVWSIQGCLDSARYQNGTLDDLEEVLRIAGLHPNIIGGVMDDFLNRRDSFPPERLQRIRDSLHCRLNRTLQLWLVVYTHELSTEIKPYLDLADTLTTWTWWAKDLPLLEENYAKIRSLCGMDKPIYAGCYMWDYGGCAPISRDSMLMQLETYRGWLWEKKIEGIILCSNCIADLGLEAADVTKEWLKQHGKEQI